MAETAASKDGIQIICRNRRALHNYSVEDRLEAGLVLLGTEVKSCRAGHAHVNDGYVQIHNNEAMLLHGHIAPYPQAKHFNHEPQRPRKLLLHKEQLARLEVATRQKGKTIIPLALYFKGGRVKAEIAVVTGKTHEDRREEIKKRDAGREIARAMRKRR